MWKKIQWQKVLPVGIEPGSVIAIDSKSNTFLSELVRHVLLRRSLNFCWCTTWCFNSDDLVGINTAWLYKELKVSVLQAYAKLVQKGECWNWNQRLWEALVLFPLRVTFCHWIFFDVVKSLMPILALLPILSSLWKTMLADLGGTLNMLPLRTKCFSISSGFFPGKIVKDIRLAPQRLAPPSNRKFGSPSEKFARQP